MKKIIIFILLFLVIFAINSSDVDISMYKLYAQSADYEAHIKNIFAIHKSADILIGNREIIKLLFNEFKYDGVNNTLSNAPENGYMHLKVESVHALGLVGDNKTANDLLQLLRNSKNKKIKEAIIFALSQIGDDDNYNISIGLLKYYKSISLSSISKDEEFCMKSVECFYELCQGKPADIVDYIGLTDLFKMFSNDKVFSTDVVEYTKRKFLNFMLSNV